MTSLKFFTIAIVSCLLLLVAVCFLPHDKYYRYQRLDLGSYSKAVWIYKRSVFDSKPIDIAFFGTSHTMNGLDSELLETLVNKNSDTKKHIVNFGLPSFGRDLHYVLPKLLMEHKDVKHIVIEVREIESRDLHAASHYLADIEDLLSAPLIVNTKFIDNLFRLPLRQTELFFKTQFPAFFGIQNVDEVKISAVKPHNNLALYAPDGSFRDKIVSFDELMKAEENWNKRQQPKMERDNALVTHLNFNASFYYVRKLVELAKENKVKVSFMYIPEYGALSKPVDELFYLELAGIIYPSNEEFYDNVDYWNDHGHLNGFGARAFTEDISDEFK